MLLSHTSNNSDIGTPLLTLIVFAAAAHQHVILMRPNRRAHSPISRLLVVGILVSIIDQFTLVCVGRCVGKAMERHVLEVEGHGGAKEIKKDAMRVCFGFVCVRAGSARVERALVSFLRARPPIWVVMESRSE